MDLGNRNRRRVENDNEDEMEMGLVVEKGSGDLKFSSSSPAALQIGDGKELIESRWSFFWILRKVCFSQCFLFCQD